MPLDRARARAREKEWRTVNPCKVDASRQKWLASNPTERARTYRRYAWKAQGIVDFTPIDYEAMHANQSGKCCICERVIRLYGTARNDGDACVDHNKMSGKVRGLLCRRCNLGLGFLGDS